MDESSDIGIKKILVIRLGAIGDVLLTTFVVRNLKKRFPDTDIDFLLKETFSSLIVHNPYVHKVIPIKIHAGFSNLLQIRRQIRQNQYDAIIDLQNNFRSRFLNWTSQVPLRRTYKLGRWKRFLLVKLKINFMKKSKPIPLRMIETLQDWHVQDDGLGLDLLLDDETKKKMKTVCQKMGMDQKKSFITIAPGASRATKQWIGSRFAEVGKHFLKKDFQVVLVGGVEDKRICESLSNQLDALPINLAGMCSLEETAAVLQNTNLLITNDTGVMHIAAAIQKPVAAIFGPTTDTLGFSPFRTPSIIIERDLNCRPCSYHGTKECPKKHFRCMMEIPAYQVIEAAETLLQGEPA